jgi:hypothetical protein
MIGFNGSLRGVLNVLRSLTTMKPRIRDILYRAIEEGVKRGMTQAHKHNDAPSKQWIEGCIEDAIWLEIDSVFNFDDEAV